MIAGGNSWRQMRRLSSAILPTRLKYTTIPATTQRRAHGGSVSARDFRPVFIALIVGVSVSALSQTNLPEGAGKEIVQNSCSGCHELGRVLRAGYSAQDWQTVVHMMKNVGAQVPDEQLPILVKYLAENFPEKSRPQGTVITGPTQVSFKEWALPTPDSRPHDPLASLDGTIWYTGQMANVLGHIDPATGHTVEYHLDTPMSGPHGLVADRRHLVHRQLCRLYRQTRRRHRQNHRIQTTKSGRARPAHAAVRSKRHPLVHRPKRQHDRTA